MPHPHLFVTKDQVDNLRSLQHVRDSIGRGHAKTLWDALLAKVENESQQEPWIPSTPLPERKATSIKHANRDFDLVARVCNRIMDASLVALVTGESRWADAALRQIECLYDPEQWPEYEDQTHLDYGDHCSLRRGQIAVALGLAYDWLYDFLTPEKRRWIIDMFDTRLTDAFKMALKTGGRFTKYKNNFVPVIYGGFQTAAMAFGDDYSETPWLHEACGPKVADYMTYFIGPEGEFDESVQYASAVDVVVNYIIAKQYHDQLDDQITANPQIAAFFKWYMYFTLPPGRVVGFGDPAPDMPPVVTTYSAAASAQNNTTFQWFYEQYFDKAPDTHRRRSLEFLYYNPDIRAEPPGADMPLGRAYQNCARLVSSRSSWDPDSTTSVVYGKATIEDNHFHADWGQLCIDGYGDRLIPDLGSPSSYPQTYPIYQNHLYYNYQQLAHNVFVFGQNETGGVSKEEPGRIGHFINTEFDDQRGATWSIDLTKVYNVAKSVTRTVVHLLPRIAVVIDDAQLNSPQPISLRWHTLSVPEIDAEGRFQTQGEHSRLAGQIVRLDGAADLNVRHHEYHEPLDVDALGEPFVQRREPYLELMTHDDHCRVATLFCVLEKNSEVGTWRNIPNGFAIDSPEGEIQATIKEDTLHVINLNTQLQWTTPLPANNHSPE